MRLNHINLPSNDVAASREFLATYLGVGTTAEPNPGMFVMMRDDGGTLLALSHFDQVTPIEYPRDFHVGFNLETRDEVERVRDRMIADGIEVEKPTKRRGRYGFYVPAPGGFVVEVSHLEMGRSSS